jgi:alkylated DNA repair dioxygenase AlkB
MTTFNEYKVINILNKDGVVNYYGKILSSEEANQYFDLLMQNILWEKDEVIIFGKHITTKRKVAWYGDSEYLYTYSNTTKQALAWTKELSELKQIVEELVGTKFNSCLQTKQIVSLVLEHGSLLIMKDATQSNWLHSLPKSKNITQARINLIFRTIHD